MRSLTVRSSTAAAVAAVLVLGGCSEGPVLDLLQQEQAGQDILTIQTDLDGIDLGSTRFLTERDGVEYFAATPVAASGTADTVCLLVEEGIGVGIECAPLERGQPGATIRDSRVTAVLLADDVDRNALADQGFELVHPNLALRPADPG